MDAISLETLKAVTGTGSLIFFVVFFATMLGWVFWPGNKTLLEKARHIPLNED